jgi:hypothetical protein
LDIKPEAWAGELRIQASWFFESTGEFVEEDKKGKSYTDHVGGLMLTSKYNKTDEFNIGFAMGKIGNP